MEHEEQSSQSMVTKEEHAISGGRSKEKGERYRIERNGRNRVKAMVDASTGGVNREQQITTRHKSTKLKQHPTMIGMEESTSTKNETRYKMDRTFKVNEVMVA